MIRVLTAEDFQLRKREKLLEYEIYEEEASDLASLIPDSRRNLSDPKWLASKDDGMKLLAGSGLARFSLDLLTLSYSAGSSLAELQVCYPAVVDAWLIHEKYHLDYGLSDQGASSTAATYALLGDAFHSVNRMVCFGLLLGWGEHLFHVARIIEYKNPRMDALIEHLLSYYVPNRDTSLAKCTRNQPYSKALKIFNAQPDARPDLMAEYLKDWYVASRREPYYDSHNRYTSFRGYWSWEAAAITFLLDIDDSSYRTSEFYPADLVDFARLSRTEARVQDE
ncbi:PoNe immunity protein domain-containing protein [Pseudoduganella sp. HUAS MS19]